MLKFLVVALLVVAGLAYAKQERVFEEAGIVSSCEVVNAPLGSTAEWWACHEGIITGFPTLARDSCKRERRAGSVEYWSCTIPIGQGRAGG